MRCYRLKAALLFSLWLIVPGGMPLVAQAPIALASVPSADHRKAEADRLFAQGNQQLQANQLKEALQSFQQALALYRQLGDKRAEGITLRSIGEVYYWLEGAKSARPFFQQAVAIYQELLGTHRQANDRASEGLTLKDLGFVFYWMEDYDQALTYQQQALTLAESLQDDDLRAKVLHNMGLAYWWKGDKPAAIDALQRSLKVAQERNNTPVIRQALVMLVTYSSELEDNARTIQFAEQALPLLAGQDDRQDRATVLHRLASAHHRLGHLEQAIQLRKEQLEVTRQLNNRPVEASVLDMLSLLYREQKDYDQALRYAQESLVLARTLKDLWREINALESLGVTYSELGQVNQAETHLEQALALARQLQQSEQPEQRQRGIFLEKLTLTRLTLLFHIIANQPDRAIFYHQQDLAVARELGDRPRESKALRELGAIYQTQADYLKAIAHFEASLAIAREIGDGASEFQALRDIGQNYLSIGSFAQAIPYQEQALQKVRQLIAQAPARPTQREQIQLRYQREQEVIAQTDLGNLYLFSEQSDRAKPQFDQALTLARKLAFTDGEALALMGLGMFYVFQGQFDRAVDFLQQAVDLEAPAALAENSTIWQKGSHSATLSTSARAYAMAGNMDIALKQAQEALALVETTEQHWGQGLEYNTLGFVQFMAGQWPAAEASMKRAIVGFDQVRAGLADNDAYKVSIFEIQAAPYYLLPRILVEQGKELEALEFAERGRARAFVELLAQRATPSQQPVTVQPPNLEQIRQIARSHQATLVEYQIQADPRSPFLQPREVALYIWVVKPNGEIVFEQVDLRPLVAQEGPKALEKLVNLSRSEDLDSRGRNLTFVENPAYVDLAVAQVDPQVNHHRYLKKLHQLLIAPIAQHLPPDPSQPVIFIPQDSLFLVPFAALQDEQDRYLIEQHTIATVPAIQILQLTQQQRLRLASTHPLASQILIVGNPTMPSLGQPPQPLNSLPGAEEEARAIAKLFNTQPLIGPQAQKSTVLQQATSASLIHLATHGLLDDYRGFGIPGAIALAPDPKPAELGEINGLLTAREILNLNLVADLVVLSACDTGRGRVTGDGVIGLSRSLLAAGTPSVVVSLWKVPDDATSFLMQQFYKNLTQGDMDKAQALRQAMLTTREQFPEPSAWAAFTLIGELE